MRRRQVASEGLSHEFELDLAPLLAVMVKLVPVLIVSSAFVPVVIIQSELPAPVAAAVSDQKPEEMPKLELVVHPTQGMDLKLTQGGKNLDQVHLNFPTDLKNLAELQQHLVRLKKQAPELFRLELLPQGDVPYEVIVKIIDAARKSPTSGERFKFKNPQSGTLEETDYMYPDVVFANVLEG
jgi:biopolymer transport protein ExbD